MAEIRENIQTELGDSTPHKPISKRIIRPDTENELEWTKLAAEARTNNPTFAKLVRVETDGTQTVLEQFKVSETENDPEWASISRDIENTRANIKAEQEYLQKYKSQDYLGHTLAYELTRQDLTQNPNVSVLEEDGSTAEYIVHRLTVNPEDKDGLVCHVLIPKNSKPGNQDIKILFQGTANAAGGMRDAFENGGAGTESFQANRDLLLLQINGLIKDFKKRMNAEESLSVTIAGHSLGGADAQNCMLAMMEGAAQNSGLNPNYPTPAIPVECRDGLGAISKLRMCTQNSAGVTKKAAKRAELVAGYIASLRKKYHKDPGKGLNLELEAHNLHVGGDGVQQTNEAHLLSGVPPEHAKVDVMKIKSAWEYKHKFSAVGAAATVAAGACVGVGTIAAAAIGVSTVVGLVGTDKTHRTKIFATVAGVCYERMDNSTAKGRQKINTTLNNKSSFLNGLQNFVLSAKEAVRKFFSGSKSPSKKEIAAITTVVIEPRQIPEQKATTPANNAPVATAVPQHATEEAIMPQSAAITAIISQKVATSVAAPLADPKSMKEKESHSFLPQFLQKITNTKVSGKDAKKDISHKTFALQGKKIKTTV